MQKENYFSGQRIYEEDLEWGQTALQNEVSNRTLDVFSAGVLEGLTLTVNADVNYLIDVCFGKGYDASGERVSISANADYNASAPSCTPPQSTGNQCIPLFDYTAGTLNYFWICEGENYDAAVYQTHRLTGATCYTKDTGGYVITVDGHIPEANGVSGSWINLGYVTANGASGDLTGCVNYGDRPLAAFTLNALCTKTKVSSTIICGTSIVCAPTIYGTTLVCSPAVCGSTTVCSPTVCGSSLVQSAIVCGTCVKGPEIIGTTYVCAPTMTVTGTTTNGTIYSTTTGCGIVMAGLTSGVGICMIAATGSGIISRDDCGVGICTFASGANGNPLSATAGHASSCAAIYACSVSTAHATIEVCNTQTGAIYAVTDGLKKTAIDGRATALGDSTSAQYGVFGMACACGGVGVYGCAPDTAHGALGLYTPDNASVGGTLSKGSGTFTIDHPLDPLNKILQHSFVESPEMLLIYGGKGTLRCGKAEICLPSYFESLNHPDSRRVYLTPIGNWAPLYISKDICEGVFEVSTTCEGIQNLSFYWSVYGVRNDKFAQAHPIIVEQDKDSSKKGTYIHPKVWGC